MSTETGSVGAGSIVVRRTTFGYCQDVAPSELAVDFDVAIDKEFAPTELLSLSKLRNQRPNDLELRLIVDSAMPILPQHPSATNTSSLQHSNPPARPGPLLALSKLNTSRYLVRIT